MLNITNKQGNANQTTKRYHLTPVRMAIIKKAINDNVHKNVEKGNLLVLSGVVKWYSHYGNSTEFPQKIKK